MTTLTKARFFEATQIRIEQIDVPGFGEVWIKDVSELQRSRRLASMFRDGQRVENATQRRRLYSVIDQVCTDADGSPMFSDQDLPELEQLAGERMDQLFAAIYVFNANGDSEKNEPAGSND